MQFIKSDINLDFIGKRKIAFIFSVAMISICVVSLLWHGGPRQGIDFAGGTLVQIKFSTATDLKSIAAGLDAAALGNSSVQQFGASTKNEYLIRTDSSITTMDDFNGQLTTALSASTGAEVEIQRVEMVGPQVGRDLREKALFAMFYALLLITIYISGRFELKWMLSGIVAAALATAVYVLNIFDVSIPFLMLAALIVSLIIFWTLELKFAMGAIVALIHDVTITVGIFSLFDKEFTLPIIAALLTIIGYSLNDTIIVYDRIRENNRKLPKQPLSFIINRSVNETLSRTILTSLTTLAVVMSLFVLGGGIIHDFAFALIVGVMVGTYSSIYVASPILLAWQKKAR
ncbi:MAG: protein translocase subunit SecF [Desulfobacteraceae bacterium]|nr:protein translocase subunit SecF [Desulfobacteraceae bacterium]